MTSSPVSAYLALGLVVGRSPLLLDTGLGDDSEDKPVKRNAVIGIRMKLTYEAIQSSRGGKKRGRDCRLIKERHKY